MHECINRDCIIGVTIFSVAFIDIVFRRGNYIGNSMTSEQGPSNGRFRPDLFSSQNTSSGNSVESSCRGAEPDGFRGPMAAHIAQWQERGWGRAIGSPLVIDGNNVEGKFHGIAYAMPFKEHVDVPEAQMSLLLFPDEKTTRYVMVMPTLTFNTDSQSGVKQFSNLLRPSRRPYVDPLWKVTPAEDPVSQFLTPRPYIQFVEELHDEREQRDVLLAVLRRRIDKEKVDEGTLLTWGPQAGSSLEELDATVVIGEQIRSLYVGENANRMLANEAVLFDTFERDLKSNHNS